MKVKLLSVLLLASSLSVFSSGCSFFQHPSRLVVQIPTQNYLNYFDPESPVFLSTPELALSCMEGLIQKDGNHHYIGAAADSWSVSDDGLVWTFHIREDARWSDGSKLMADDFVTGFNLLLSLDLFQDFLGKWMMGIETSQASIDLADRINSSATQSKTTDQNQVPDHDHTPIDLVPSSIKALSEEVLEITLAHPCINMEEILCAPWMVPQKESSRNVHYRMQYGDNSYLYNGPYRPCFTESSSQTKLVRNPAYHSNALPEFDEIYLSHKLKQEDVDALDFLQDGLILRENSSSVSALAMDLQKQDSQDQNIPYKSLTTLSDRVLTLEADPQKEDSPLKDQKLRSLLYSLVDPLSIAQTLKTCQPFTDSFSSQTILAQEKNTQSRFDLPGQNEETAEDLDAFLDAAGIHLLSLRLGFENIEDQGAIAEKIKEQFEETGRMEIELVPMAENELSMAIADHTCDLFLTDNNQVLDTPFSTLVLYASHPYSDWPGKQTDETYDACLLEAAKADNTRAQMDLYQQATELLSDKGIAYILVQDTETVTYSSNLELPALVCYGVNLPEVKLARSEK